MMFRLQQMASSFESKCRSQQGQLPHAETMRQVRDWGHASIASELRGMPGVREAETRLRWAAERRMEDLLDEQLNKLGECKTTEDFKKLHGRLQLDEWIFLRGDFARVFVKAERESYRIKHQLDQRIAAGAEIPEPPEEANLDAEQTTARKSSGARPK